MPREGKVSTSCTGIVLPVTVMFTFEDLSKGGSCRRFRIDRRHQYEKKLKALSLSLEARDVGYLFTVVNF